MSKQATEQTIGQDNGLTEMELAVSGMTCGSCATRVQRTLSKREGVEAAAVNFATGKATVRFDASRVSVDDLVAAAGKIGYGLVSTDPAHDSTAGGAENSVQAMAAAR